MPSSTYAWIARPGSEIVLENIEGLIDEEIEIDFFVNRRLTPTRTRRSGRRAFVVSSPGIVSECQIAEFGQAPSRRHGHGYRSDGCLSAHQI
jgi:hypothetical protein